jgi:Ran GTPase-activating protein 1
MYIFSKALAGSGGKGVRAFTDLLKSLENLEELYVMNDGISEEVAAALFELIPSIEKLRFFTPTT